jgi:pyruvate/2-oxoglutarate dehydrogenase complex dihydrolipoamide acyltransferase (E2) component
VVEHGEIFELVEIAALPELGAAALKQAPQAAKVATQAGKAAAQAVGKAASAAGQAVRNKGIDAVNKVFTSPASYEIIRDVTAGAIAPELPPSSPSEYIGAKVGEGVRTVTKGIRRGQSK